jgi:hypothetical protein
MRHIRHPARLGAIAAALLLALGCGVLALWHPSGTARARLASERARWEAQAPASYRLRVRETTGAGSCIQSVEVEHERIRRVLENTCGRVPTWTVTSLFGWVEQAARRESRCYPTSVTCVCYADYLTETEYDAALGYPRRATSAWSLRPNLGYAGQWRRLLRDGRLPNCDDVTRSAGDAVTIVVLAFEPQPSARRT